MNVLVADEARRILFLSQTYEGSAHDKRIADEEAIVFGSEFGKTVELLQDLGFQGYAPEGAVVIQPVKKPRGKSLTDAQKQSNRELSRARVVIEHAIGGVKTWRIVKEQIRSWCHALRDRVMYLACGLHNFRLQCREILSNVVDEEVQRILIPVG